MPWGCGMTITITEICPRCGARVRDITQGGILEIGCWICGWRDYPTPPHTPYIDDEPDAPRRGRPLKSGATKYKTTITHCPQGHEYTEENTYFNGHSRNCKTCRRERKQRSRKERA